MRHKLRVIIMLAILAMMTIPLYAADKGAAPVAHSCHCEGGARSNPMGLLRSLAMTQRLVIASLLKAGEAISDWLCPAVYAADKGAAPVAHWRFDEGGGPTAYDDAGANDGTLANGAKFAAGKFGKAVQFDGSDDQVNLASAVTLTGEFTISMWFNKTDSAALRTLISKSASASTKIFFDAGNNLGVRAVTSITYTNIGYTGAMDGAWHHLVVVRDASNVVKAYLDGGSPVTCLTEAGDSIWEVIGRTPGDNQNFNGLIDDVRIYNYARTAAQILIDYNAGSAAHLGAGTDPNEGNPPVGYWKFDENTGQYAYDRSGNGNNGTITGASWTTGKYGSALDFNGTSDLVNCGSGSSLYPSGALSVEAWFKRDTVNSSICALVRCGGQEPYRIGFNTSADTVQFRVRGTSNQQTAWVSFPLGMWHHVVGTYDLNKIKLYRDGELVSEVTAGDVRPYLTQGDLIIGRDDATTGRWYDGKIDEVKIYDYALTQAQIAYDYNRGAPVAHYKFDEGTGTIAHNKYSTAGSGGAAPVGWLRMDNNWNDSSGNGNNGTAGGVGATFSTSSIIGPYCGSFDGTSSAYVNTGAGIDFASSQFSSGFTIESWVKPAATPASTKAIFSSAEGTSGNLWQVYVWYDIANKFGTAQRYSGIQNDYVGSAHSPGSWYHVTVAWDGTTSRLYVNGVLENSAAGGRPDNQPAAREVRIGDFKGYANSEFNGQIDDVRIYNYARTAEQIYNDYKTTHGTLVGDTKFVDGKIGKAVQMDGAGDYVAVSSYNPVFTGDFTINFWTKFNAYNNYQNPISTADDGNATNGFWLEFGSTRGFTLYNTGTSLALTDNVQDLTSLNTGQWYYITVVRSGSGTNNLKLYVDNSLAGQNTYTGTIGSATQSLLIGKYCHNATSSWMNGLIDDVRIYNYARTAAQILEDYTAGAARLGAQSAGVADPWGGALPVGHWKLDENTGVLARDASGNGYNGTITGSSWTQGKAGPCLNFSATNDKVQTSDPILSGTGDFSITAWINRSVAGTTDYIAGNYGTGAYSTGIEFYVTANKLYVYIGAAVIGATTINADAWYHMAVTRSSGAIKLYVNGAQDGSGTLAGSISGGNWAIGNGPNYTSERFEGKIDDVKVYNYARTQAQIAWDFNRGKPVGHWRMNEKAAGQAVDLTAGAIKDESDNNNDGTASNTTWTAYAAGKFGSALSFDGNDYVSVTDGANSCFDFGTENFTLSVWVKTTMGATGDWVGILSKYTSNNFWIQLNPANKYVGFGWDGSNYLTSSKSVNDGNWHHIVGVRTGTTSGAIYVDGVKVIESSSLPNNNLNDNTEVRIGSLMAGTPRYFIGQLDDARIYNYARTADQILQDYLNGASVRLGD